MASIMHVNGLIKKFNLFQTQKPNMSMTASRGASGPIFENRDQKLTWEDQSFVAVKVRPDDGYSREMFLQRINKSCYDVRIVHSITQTWLKRKGDGRTSIKS